MGNVVSVLNMMSKKRNTDSIEMRQELNQAQTDNSTTMAQLEAFTNETQAESCSQQLEELVQKVESAADDNETKKLTLQTMETQMEDLQDDNEVIKGLLFRHSMK